MCQQAEAKHDACNRSEQANGAAKLTATHPLHSVSERLSPSIRNWFEDALATRKPLNPLQEDSISSRIAPQSGNPFAEGPDDEGWWHRLAIQ